jgi:hypothetical protein
MAAKEGTVTAMGPVGWDPFQLNPKWVERKNCSEEVCKLDNDLSLWGKGCRVGQIRVRSIGPVRPLWCQGAEFVSSMLDTKAEGSANA